MKNIIRIEEALLFAFSIFLFSQLDFAWWWFPLLLLTPDLSMLGYLHNPKTGAFTYNLIHHKGVGVAAYVLGVLLAQPVLMLAVVINLPLVLERVDLFYRAAFLQNLRADFSDLDQHLASRDASVRLLAKLPEPVAVVGDSGSHDEAEIDLARARYTQWINRILGEERDITEIRFLDSDGVERFWLERDAQSGEWKPT